MNEVSIIINGVRYDAVEVEHGTYPNICDCCDLNNNGCCELAACPLDMLFVFKKSDKKFEP